MIGRQLRCQRATLLLHTRSLSQCNYNGSNRNTSFPNLRHLHDLGFFSKVRASLIGFFLRAVVEGPIFSVRHTSNRFRVNRPHSFYVSTSLMCANEGFIFVLQYPIVFYGTYGRFFRALRFRYQTVMTQGRFTLYRHVHRVLLYGTTLLRVLVRGYFTSRHDFLRGYFSTILYGVRASVKRFYFWLLLRNFFIHAQRVRLISGRGDQGIVIPRRPPRYPHISLRTVNSTSGGSYVIRRLRHTLRLHERVRVSQHVRGYCAGQQFTVRVFVHRLRPGPHLLKGGYCSAHPLLHVHVRGYVLVVRAPRHASLPNNVWRYLQRYNLSNVSVNRRADACVFFHFFELLFTRGGTSLLVTWC